MPDPKATLLGKAAVFEGLPEHPALKAILGWNADALTDARFDRGELTLTIARDAIRGACSALISAGYNAFQDVTAVDWFPNVPRFHVVYHACSYSLKDTVRLKVMVDEADPTVESITPVWPGANYYEREVFDLFGIRFEGHPNLRRILLPDDWVGYPLRKDYPVEGYR
ncbi:MAG TPA: NADH-quinone oxidoreductase subunit C [Terracidiphilus sp.]|jgi:NADH-quinone oxidoreductase subunit C|nr:NADH-quinone oxidoreductase subunit C [Terracidiphilus sp.]